MTNENKQEWEFKECDMCSKKPGSPVLCDGCINNRKAIDSLVKEKAFLINVIINNPSLKRRIFQSLKSNGK